MQQSEKNFNLKGLEYRMYYTTSEAIHGTMEKAPNYVDALMMAIDLHYVGLILCY